MHNKLSSGESNMLTNTEKMEQKFAWVFWGSFALFLACYAIRPIYDPDFWWHLKTGEFMVQNRGLLQFDPFTFTGDGVVSSREALILKGYWLWQLAVYSLYALIGFNGIFLLSLVTVFAMAGVVAQQMHRRQVGLPIIALLMTFGFFLLNTTYAFERPQVVSFLFAGILLGLLDRVRSGGKLGWSLPLLMMVWANFHSGFVVGDIIMVCFAVGAFIEFRQDAARLRHLFTWIALGLGASLLNPNGALVLIELFSFHNSALMAGVSEYRSTWVIFQNGLRAVSILWLLIVLYGIGLWSARRLYWPDLVVAIFLAYFSCAYARNIGFFAVGMLPAIGFYLQEGLRRRQWQLPAFLSLLLLSLCTVLLLWISYGLGKARLESGPVKLIYPENAVSFLRTSGLKGRMFNSYEYGSYLLWQLAPQIKVFIDGRGMDPKVFDDSNKIRWASSSLVDGRREYEVLLDRYAIDYIIQPIYDGDGNIQPLMKGLLGRPEWSPIYLDSMVYILARNTPNNTDVIRAYRIDVNEFKTRLLLIIDYISRTNPNETGYQVARAGMLIYMSQYEEAAAQVEKIRTNAPNTPGLTSLQRELEMLQTKRMR